MITDQRTRIYLLQQSKYRVCIVIYQDQGFSDCRKSLELRYRQTLKKPIVPSDVRNSCIEL
jgi:hypothetical protein